MASEGPLPGGWEAVYSCRTRSREKMGYDLNNSGKKGLGFTVGISWAKF